MDESRADAASRALGRSKVAPEPADSTRVVPTVREPRIVGQGPLVREADVPELEPPRIPAPHHFRRHYQPEPGGGVEVVDPGADVATTDQENSGIVSRLMSAAEPVANVVEPIVENLVMPVAGAIGGAIDAATSAFGVRDAISERWNHRGPEPLPNLYEAHPESREAAPRELGFRFVPIEEIRGTAVAGIAQRGTDFLPLPPFRGSNWQGRWQRIKQARDALKPLPPLDLIKYNGEYWVVDGHNRVAAAIDGKGVGVDAMVIELVPLDGQVSERPTSVLQYLGESGALRNAAQGRQPASHSDVTLPTMPQPDTNPTSEIPPEVEDRKR